MIRYFIMTMTGINGVINGWQGRIGNLFFVELQGDGHDTRALWAQRLADAKSFDTEEEARAEASKIWGEWFVNSTFVIVAAHDHLYKVNEEQPVD